jgi:MFS family permease
VLGRTVPDTARVLTPVQVQPPGGAAALSLLRNREFSKLWAGQTISVFGDQITTLALPLAAVLTLDAGAFQMGLLTALMWLPHLLFSLHAGVFIDRRARKRQTMIVADIARALVLASVPLAYAFDVLTIWQLFAVAFLHGTCAVFFDLSWSTIFVALVPREQFVDANSKLFQSRSLSYVAGPSVAGFLVQVLRAPLALLADALSFLASAFILWRIHAIEPPPEEEPDERLRLAAGMQFIWRNAAFRASLLSFSTINFFSLMYGALFVLYATKELNVKPGTLGLVLGAGAVGALIGAVFAPRLSRAIGVGQSVVVGSLLSPAPLMLIPAAGGPQWLVLTFLVVAEFFAGMGVMILDVNGNSLGAALTPDRMRARIAGAHRTINYGVRPVGALLAGVLGEAIGLRPTLWIATVGALLGVLWLLPSPVPRMRELPEPS